MSGDSNGNIIKMNSESGLNFFKIQYTVNLGDLKNVDFAKFDLSFGSFQESGILQSPILTSFSLLPVDAYLIVMKF